MPYKIHAIIWYSIIFRKIGKATSPFIANKAAKFDKYQTIKYKL